MEVLELKSRPRMGRGRGYRNRLKALGLIPAVVYGKEVGSVPVEVETRAVEDILNKGGRNTLVKLEIESENQELQRLDTIIKELQIHPYRNEIMHLDLHQISLKEELVASVALRLTGTAPGAVAGGLLEQLLRQVEVSCLPRNIPDHIEVDVSGLQIGDSIHVAELKAPAEVKFVTEGETTVATVIALRGEEVPEPVEEEVPEADKKPTPETEQ